MAAWDVESVATELLACEDERRDRTKFTDEWPELDVATGTVTDAIEAGAVPKYAALSPDEKTMLVSNWCDFDLSVIDVESGKETGRIPLGRWARGIAFHPDGHAYATALAARPTDAATTAPHPLTLWYRQPAAKWTEALPIGNGRLGAMVFGRVGQERDGAPASGRERLQRQADAIVERLKRMGALDDARLADLESTLVGDLKRLQAEYANYRRRAERERTAVAQQAKAKFAEQLLPLLDDLDRACFSPKRVPGEHLPRQALARELCTWESFAIAYGLRILAWMRA